MTDGTNITGGAGGKGSRVAGRTEKRCPRCGLVQPVCAFGSDRHRPDGLHAFCRPCHRAYRKERAARFPEQERAAQAAYYRAHKSARVAASSRWLARARQVSAALAQGESLPRAHCAGFLLIEHAPSGRVAAHPAGVPIPARFVALCEVLPLAGECLLWSCVPPAHRDAAQATARIATLLVARKGARR